MRRVCEGSFHVALAPERAASLFTPEGERAWAPGWDPAYPAGCGTRAHVAYDLTALSDAADLDGFAAAFDALMGAWERHIAAAL